MAPQQQGILHSDLRRQKRRATAKIQTAMARIVDAMFVLQDAANSLSISYEQAGQKDAQQKANSVVNALATKRIYVQGDLDLDKVVSLFNNLPED
jgi:hypothetical protein